MKENNELVGELCLSFYSVYKLFSQHYTKLLSEFDLTYTQYLVLMVLWKNPRQTLSEVGKRLDLSSNTLTPLFKRLEEKGYIKRIKTDADKRQLYIELTAAGKALELEVLSKIKETYQQLDQLDEQQIANTIKNNNLLIKILQEAKDR